MDALGRFEVAFDVDLGCFYLENEFARSLPVWPFGYSAGENPMLIFDADGKEVAAPGDRIEAGGGGADLDRVDEPNKCGTSNVWIFNGDSIRRVPPEAESASD